MTLKFFCKLMKVYFRNCELEIYDRKLRSHLNANGRKLMNVYWLSKWPLCSYGNPHMSQTTAEMYAGSTDCGELCRLWINLYTPFGPLGLKWAKREAVCFPGEWLAYEWCFEEKFKDAPCQLQSSCLPKYSVTPLILWCLWLIFNSSFAMAVLNFCGWHRYWDWSATSATQLETSLWLWMCGLRCVHSKWYTPPHSTLAKRPRSNGPKSLYLSGI